jgi:hypothetical protein
MKKSKEMQKSEKVPRLFPPQTSEEENVKRMNSPPSRQRYIVS